MTELTGGNFLQANGEYLGTGRDSKGTFDCFRVNRDVYTARCNDYGVYNWLCTISAFPSAKRLWEVAIPAVAGQYAHADGVTHS
jgi:hypothetical protein